MKNRIVTISETLGISLNAMSKELGYTPSYLSRVLSGNLTLNSRLVSLICSTYSISETWLRTGEGDMFAAPEEEDDEVFRRVLKQKVRSLPPEAQAMILEFCRDMQDALSPAPEPAEKKRE